MRIFIDIGHPAHVHYFRNLITKLEDQGDEVKVVARDRKFVKELLDYYNIDFVSRGKGSDTRIGKFIYMLKADLQLLKMALKFKPDMFLSFSSPYAGQVSFLMRKPHIALNDTEHSDAIFSIFTYPFCSSILTPMSFQNSLGLKQIRFNNVVEGLYLHKDYFETRPDYKLELGINEDVKYVVFRLVSFHAHHDFNQDGISMETKTELITLLRKNNFRVFISSEEELPDEYKKYEIQIKPEYMHQVLAGATLFIGESATMASESSMLGTFSVYINSSPITCNTKLQQEAGIAKYFKPDELIVPYVKELISNDNLKSDTVKKSIEMQDKFIDPTRFLTWFINEYPESKRIMSNNPNFQDKFISK